MKVGPTLLQQLNDRLLRNFENEERTEALLLGEPYESNQGILRQLVPPRRRSSYQLTGREDYYDAIKYAMMYGSNIRSMARVAPDPVINGMKATQAILDKVSFTDIEKLMENLLVSSCTRPKEFASPYGGSPDDFMDFPNPEMQELQGALPRAEPNRGPQPRKANIHRRK